MTTTHLIGLLLGTEDDWPTAFEQYLGRLAPSIELDGETHEVATERVTIEPSTCASPSATPWSSTASPTGTTTHGSGSRRSP